MCCCAPTVELWIASWLADVHAQNEALAAKDVEFGNFGEPEGEAEAQAQADAVDLNSMD